jgi:hypothetical protein
MPRARTLIALTLAALAIASARADDKPAAPAAAPAIPDAKATTTPITLIDAGEAPRKPLRLTLKAGTKQRAIMRMQMKLDISMDGRPLPPQPAMKLRTGIETEITSVTDTGATVRVVYPFVEAEDPDAPYAATLNAKLAGIEKCRVEMVISPRGEVLSSKLDVPPGLDPMIAQQMEQMNQSINQMILILPEQPVGRHARWSLTRSIKTNGLSLDTVLNVEVAEINGETLAIKLTNAGKAVDQPLSGPGIPAGAATIELMEVIATGNQSMRLDRVVPTASQGTSDATVAMKLTQGAATQKMNQKMAIKVELVEPHEGEFKPFATAKPAEPTPAGK